MLLLHHGGLRVGLIRRTILLLLKSAIQGRLLESLEGLMLVPPKKRVLRLRVEFSKLLSAKPRLQVHSCAGSLLFRGLIHQLGCKFVDLGPISRSQPRHLNRECWPIRGAWHAHGLLIRAHAAAGLTCHAHSDLLLLKQRLLRLLRLLLGHLVCLHVLHMLESLLGSLSGTTSHLSLQHQRLSLGLGLGLSLCLSLSLGLSMGMGLCLGVGVDAVLKVGLICLSLLEEVHDFVSHGLVVCFLNSLC